MKNILFVFTLISSTLFAQQNDKNWKKVLAFENEGKIKSANELVAKIYKKATVKKDEVEMIKCFFYQAKYLLVIDENAKTKILDNLKTDINRVSIPSKAILTLIYAKCLNHYSNYDEYAVVVDSAATVVDEASLIDEAAATIDTAAIDGIAHQDSSIYLTPEKEIIALYNKTLENEGVPKNTPLNNYAAIFEFYSDKFKTSTLYDYVLDENIAFYKEKIKSWNITYSDFFVHSDELLGSSNSFTTLNLDFVKDEYIKKTLELYQKKEKDNPSLENQFERVKFCNSVLIHSDEAFSQYVDKTEKIAKDENLLQKIKLEKAELLANKASKEFYPNNNIEALKILDEIIQINKKSNTANLALYRKRELTAKSVSIQLEKYIYDNENTRAYISYKNLNRLKVSYYKINLSQVKKFQKQSETARDSLYKSTIKNQTPIISEDYDLKNKNDYFEYNTELLLPKLTIGNYLVYFESDSDTKNQRAFAYEVITVSNISVLATRQDKIENYQVLDRKTGKPLENVTVKFSTSTAKTDSKGIASLKLKNESYNYEPVEFSIGNDSILIHKNYLRYISDYNLSENERANAKIEFYLDRAIYRPGQTVYFKGIAIQKSKNKNSVVPNTTFKVVVNDVNYQKINEFELTTNEFGSFSGEFILPKNGLTGNFHIGIERPDEYEKKENAFKFWNNVNFNNSTIYFSVEEYKRPKFEVTFDAKKESFKLNESVKIKGTATAFAGSNISDAVVKYTVNRYTTYFRNYYGHRDNETLAVGETKTDASGKFTIDFTASPSNNNTKEQRPIFNYEINVSVTDINGETHSAVTTVKVGYHDLIIDALIPNTIETKDKNEIILTSTNLNGEFLAAKGEIKLYFVSPFPNKFKPRIFNRPEIETISAKEFERLFPYEINDNPFAEKSPEVLLFSKKVDTQKDKKIILDFISNYKSGNYKVVFSAKDSFQNAIETTTNFSIKQSKDKFHSDRLFSAEQINDDPKKDGFVLVKLSSVIPELYITANGNYQNKVYFEDTFHLQNHEVVIKIPLKNEFEKQIKIGFESIFDNASFTDAITVDLKTQEPKLEWIVETFRNKVQPGSAETWSFKLNGIAAKIEAEVLASMYDSSLDQFTKKDWDILKLDTNYYNSAATRSVLGFDMAYLSLENLNEIFPQIDFYFDDIKLNWFGFDFYNSRFGTAHSSITIAELKDKKVGVETDAVLAAGAPLAAPSVMKEESIEGSFKASKKAPGIRIRGNGNISGNEPIYIVDGETVTDIKSINPKEILSMETLDPEKATALYGSRAANGAIIITTKKALEALTQVKARKNLSETAFFLPNLKTDSKGKVSFNFTSPEALTAWKFRLLAHNKDAVSGYLEKSVITQKEIMVVPNFPRFFREKDEIVINAKISNITDLAKTGIASLQFFDAVTMEPIDAKMLNTKNIRNFTIPSHGNTSVSWTITIPEGLQGVQYKIIAKAGNFSDGEENILPVLTNNMLVTESIPVWVRENAAKEYTFENLKNNNSTTLKNHQFTFEYTSNPTWLAIQSLPYLMEYEHECAEQTFARYYANSLASEIIYGNPKIAAVFEEWRKSGKPVSKLEENEELKSLILAETPWLNDAQSEDQKKKNLSLLFDLEKMKTSLESAFEKLKQKQNTSGAFSWFEGGYENEYITRHILAGLGHLNKLTKTAENKADEIAKNGIPFLDTKFIEYHKTRTKNLKEINKLIWINPYSDLHYLYTRSFYLEKYPQSDTLKKTIQLYLDKAKKDWLNYSIYEKGLAAITLNRFGEKETAKKIIESLKETSSNNEDWGMYWIANKSGWYWYQAPIETQALLIEAFAEVTNDTKSVDAMKVWLLKNKQTKNWPTTKSTTEAVYALLMQGTDWLSVKDNTIIKLGDEKIMTKKLAENQKEAETGYIKLNWKAEEVKKEMASISIQNKSKVPGFGGVYWQYFEDLDKIKNNSGAVLSVSKELYIKKSSLKGDQLHKITSKDPLKTGDLVTVRLIITAKEDSEYVHLKDMRASSFEPVNVLSEYQYKNRLGYYMSTKDAATHFFFDQINKGTYVLEYDIRVNNSGEFSNGITTIQSMYAPEFASHTKGIRVKVE
ncbi:TonB-dependent SusC/RagA subfamily outer membrane receptor [Flavobacterium sp. HSC-32F16]|uniref:alpha-2-macroglobulin family protein n=1 Tax=Flavobacterium sp. HSC-32F16 TaxID=2910964 RepID=UPI0020A51106|nr:alpha-2-macroglobulin family protein [Flavobacterium sp. HSC-32F16]MCP2029276.1 TonB-dependent SusC/RagA subfamily outer membrane receptor [Flavobacterium sp. HSC-32F16]